MKTLEEELDVEEIKISSQKEKESLPQRMQQREQKKIVKFKIN